MSQWFFSTQWKTMVLVLYFCVPKKKVSRTVVEQYEGGVNDDKMFIFLVNQPFKNVLFTLSIIAITAFST